MQRAGCRWRSNFLIYPADLSDTVKSGSRSWNGSMKIETPLIETVDELISPYRPSMFTIYRADKLTMARYQICLTNARDLSDIDPNVVLSFLRYDIAGNRRCL